MDNKILIIKQLIEFFDFDYCELQNHAWINFEEKNGIYCLYYITNNDNEFANDSLIDNLIQSNDINQIWQYILKMIEYGINDEESIIINEKIHQQILSEITPQIQKPSNLKSTDLIQILGRAGRGN